MFYTMHHLSKSFLPITKTHKFERARKIKTGYDYERAITKLARVVELLCNYFNKNSRLKLHDRVLLHTTPAIR